MIQCKTIGFIVGLVIASAVFFPVFFKVNLPEIQRAAYTQTTCQNLNSTIVSRYCCYSTCSSCSSSVFGTSDCGPLINTYNSYSPSACSSNTTNQCPTQGQTCGSGYKCCDTCCDTCTSCTTSCSNNVCTQSCHSYDCNCYCCQSVNNLLCTISCPLCYTADIEVSYPVSGGSQVATYSQDFKTDLTLAKALVNSKPVGGSESCYYDPKNMATVTFDVSYTVGSWVGFGVVALLMWTVLVYGTKIFICDNYCPNYSNAANIFLWFGILLPFGLFLPLKLAARVDDKTRNDFLYAMIASIIIGVVPLAIARRYNRRTQAAVEAMDTWKQYKSPKVELSSREVQQPSNAYASPTFPQRIYQPPNNPPPGSFIPPNQTPGYYQPPPGPPPTQYKSTDGLMQSSQALPQYPNGVYQPPSNPPPGVYQPQNSASNLHYLPPKGPPPDTPYESQSRPSTSKSLSLFGTRPSTAMSKSVISPMIVAISEARGAYSEIGLVSLDLETSLCTITQYADTASYVHTIHKLGILNPAKNGKYYALAAISALFKFIEYTQKMVFKNHSVKFSYESIDGTMLIDSTTATLLELFANKFGNNRACLLGLLDKTKTGMGTRLLKSNILQPLRDIETISNRQDAIQEILESESLLYELAKDLNDIPDLNKVITGLIQIPKKITTKYSEQSINRILALKFALQKTQVLAECMDTAQSPLLTKIHKANFEKTPIGLRNQRCHAVNSNLNQLLDVARQTYKEGTNDIHELLEHYYQEYELRIELKFKNADGYSMCIGEDQLESGLPPEFVNQQNKNSKIYFTSMQMVNLNMRIKESLKEIYKLSEEEITKLVIYVHEYLPIFYRLAEAIALLDVIVSLAKVANLDGYTKPEFTDTLAFKNSRHPVMERELMFKPNDAFADSQSRIQLVSGANMSGKSTYLTQIALIVIMAQIGSFVPCEFATVRITDKLLARIGHDDSYQAQISSFTNEMYETSFILDNFTDESLIIIDELGRGTSTSDGTAISIAVCEYLLQKKAFVVFATHFDKIYNFLSTGPNVLILHFQCPDSLHCYTIKNGACTTECYGVELAKKAGFGAECTTQAAEISQKLRDTWRELNENNPVYLERILLSQKQKVILLAVDDCDLVGAAVKWTIQSCIQKGDTLVIASCSSTIVPTGRNMEAFAGLKKKAAEDLKLKLKAFTHIAQQDSGITGFQVMYEIGGSKHNQNDLIINLIQTKQPRKVILFLDPSQQSIINRFTIGDSAKYISRYCQSPPTILTQDMVRKLDDMDIWSLGTM
ncbi:MutS protein msh4 [Terramyces sp. JEL0728]|nr:MutS protein msh4 [Terramyces sp. JEL0728]